MIEFRFLFYWESKMSRCPTARQERNCCLGAMVGAAWGFLIGLVGGGAVGATIGPQIGCVVGSFCGCVMSGPHVHQ
jgi:hypothetical protein